MSKKQFWCWMFLSALVFYLLAACHQPLPENSSESNTRPIEHAMGWSQVPQMPQRIVTLDSAPLDAALALKIKPVGSVAWDGEFSDYLSDRTNGIAKVGIPQQPSLEAIAQLKPDLILSSKVVSEGIYPQLAQIAPTVLTEGSGRDGKWPDDLRLYANALGKRDLAEELLKTYQDRITTLKQQLKDTHKTVVSVIATYKGAVGFYSEKSFSGVALQELGFQRPPIQAQWSDHGDDFSKESFMQHDGDIIFFLTGKTAQQLSLDEFVKDPLFSQLSAVKKGQIYTVSSDAWSAGRNILAAHWVLDDIVRVLGNPQKSVSPEAKFMVHSK